MEEWVVSNPKESKKLLWKKVEKVRKWSTQTFLSMKNEKEEMISRRRKVRELWMECRVTVVR